MDILLEYLERSLIIIQRISHMSTIAVFINLLKLAIDESLQKKKTVIRTMRKGTLSKLFKVEKKVIEGPKRIEGGPKSISR